MINEVVTVNFGQKT